MNFMAWLAADAMFAYMTYWGFGVLDNGLVGFAGLVLTVMGLFMAAVELSDDIKQYQGKLKDTE